ncbi:MAG TPA: ABC transporter substrate-binding protein [Symbiobacteriaceae bacterium]|nr:ABC transporter substrate-binding protein [Symbiobacteriaceae bacterium]
MMKQGRTVRALIAGSLALLMLAGCGAPKLDDAQKSPAPGTTDTAKAPIKLGLTISLSGGTADMGEAARDGAQLAIKELNEKGGIKGQPLELTVYDDETKPEKGLENVKRLIDQDKVVAFLGPANTGVALNQVDYVQQSQVLMLVTASAGTAVTQKFKDQDKNYILRTSMVDAAQAPTMVDFLVKNKGLKKIAILHDTTAYGVGGKNDMVARLKNKWNLDPVAVESFKVGDTDLSAQVEKAKAAGADAVATYALGPELAQVMKALSRANWKVPVVGSWTITGELFHKLAGDLVENDVYGVMSVHPSKSETYKAFDAKMQKAYGRNNFAPVAAQSYDGIYILAKAIEKAGTDPKAVRDAVEATTGFAGVTNTPAAPWSKGKPEALGLKDMFIGKWTGGKLEPVANSTVTE